MLLKLLPVLLAFLAGWGGRRLGWLQRRHADILLASTLWIGLPAIVLGSISNLRLDPQLTGLPLLAMLMVLLFWPLSRLCAGLLRLPPKRRVVMMMAMMIMNLAVTYPFVRAFWGAEGLALLTLFDFGHSLLVITLVYGIAAWYGQGGDARLMLRSLLRFPPLPALALALLLNLSGIGLWLPLAELLISLGGGWMLLVLVALGICVEKPGNWTPELWLAVAGRSLGGAAVGLLLATLFGLEELMLAIVVLGAGAPVGFNTLVFASRQQLDKQFATELVTLSIIFGLAWLPLLATLLSHYAPTAAF